MQGMALVIAGIIFSLVGVIHLLRLINQWTLIIAGTSIPMYVSVIGLIVCIILSLWMFFAAATKT